MPALVLLDLNLPGMDGWQVTEWIRSVGHDAGADGHGAGRGGGRHPRARGRARTTTSPSRSASPSSSRGSPPRSAAPACRGARDEDAPLEFDGLRIEPVTHRVVGDAAEVHLTPTEFRLLLTLARRQDGLVGHADLLRAVWGPTYGEETQLLRVTMRNLRAKLGDGVAGTHVHRHRVRPGLPVPAGALRALCYDRRPSHRPIGRSQRRLPVSLPRPRAIGAPRVTTPPPSTPTTSRPPSPTSRPSSRSPSAAASSSRRPRSTAASTPCGTTGPWASSSRTTSSAPGGGRWSRTATTSSAWTPGS